MRDVNSLNKVILVGQLGQKPELRHLPQATGPSPGSAMATNERSFNPDRPASADDQGPSGIRSSPGASWPSSATASWTRASRS
ncbi:MAG: hypothetical protein MZW92_72660 [Comamonadaceae bacterium]|nr:hypothetical protein [Comamonadaceae bacterium]